MSVAHVLFLDCDYRRLHVADWPRATRKLAAGKVEVVHYSRDKTIQRVDGAVPMPSVVRVLRRFRRDRMKTKFSRLNVYVRDNFTCQYDGRQYATEDLTFDHVQPRSRGGKTCWENIVTCCVDCNSRKSNRTPAEAGMRLLKLPKKPHYLPTFMVKTIKPSEIPEEWRPYWYTDLES
jgi:5-methylcytosine-specific restriction endonuclease McrA